MQDDYCAEMQSELLSEMSTECPEDINNDEDFGNFVACVASRGSTRDLRDFLDEVASEEYLACLEDGFFGEDFLEQSFEARQSTCSDCWDGCDSDAEAFRSVVQTLIQVHPDRPKEEQEALCSLDSSGFANHVYLEVKSDFPAISPDSSLLEWCGTDFGEIVHGRSPTGPLRKFWEEQHRAYVQDACPRNGSNGGNGNGGNGNGGNGGNGNGNGKARTTAILLSLFVAVALVVFFWLYVLESTVA